ncbi:MAG: 3'-5' exonuclease [Spirochaetaceae bacterium]|nr:MAG: 3'-5' exonuclease [Spirochaetaceae bacterium]
MNHLVISDSRAFSEYLSSLAHDYPTVALDIEGEFNLHQYGETLCLIQLFDGDRAAIVDPFPLSNEELQQLFEHPRIEKIMYDAMSDQSLLLKGYGSRIVSIVDLKPAVDLLEFEKRDLGSVLEAALGISVEKKKKFQRYNWTRRPIEPDAIEYALSDVLHLFQLRDVLFEELERRGLTAEYNARNRQVQEREIDVNRAPRLLRSNEVKRMPRTVRTRFEQIYQLRDRHARELNLPPDTVIVKASLFALARGEQQPAGLRPHARVPRAAHARLVAELTSLLAEPSGSAL